MAAASLLAVAENKVQTLYIYGFAASFNDSTVYFTDIQKVDSAYIDSKTKFLIERENYSYQLRDYLKSQGWSTPTCVTTYAMSRDDAEKKFVAMKKKYVNGGHYTIKYLTSAEFKYQAIKPTEIVYVSSGDKASAQESEAGKDKEKKAKGKHGDRPTPPNGFSSNGERPMGPPPSGMPQH